MGIYSYDIVLVTLKQIIFCSLKTQDTSYLNGQEFYEHNVNATRGSKWYDGISEPKTDSHR